MTDNFAHRAAEWDSPQKVKMTEVFVKTLLQKVPLNKTWKALEIGAGTGLVGLQVQTALGSIVFEDTSEAMLAVLKTKLAADHTHSLVHGEVYQYTKPDLDFVFSCMAFHHIPDVAAAIAHLSKITKKGAYLVVGDIRTEDGSFHRFEPIPHKGFDTQWLKTQFNNASFEVLESDTYNVLKRERTPGIFTQYEQFMLIARKL